MNDLKVSDMLQMSYDLWEANKESWSPMEAEHGKTFVLYMIEEIGEVISLIKKKNLDDLKQNGEHRERFIEEMADVMMYYSDVLNRFGVTPEEFTRVYMKKHNSNLNRNFEKDHKEY